MYGLDLELITALCPRTLTCTTDLPTPVLSVAQSDFCDFMDCNRQAPLSMKSSRQGILKWVAFPTSGNLPGSGRTHVSCIWQAVSLPLSYLRSPTNLPDERFWLKFHLHTEVVPKTQDLFFLMIIFFDQRDSVKWNLLWDSF